MIDPGLLPRRAEANRLDANAVVFKEKLVEGVLHPVMLADVPAVPSGRTMVHDGDATGMQRGCNEDAMRMQRGCGV